MSFSTSDLSEDQESLLKDLQRDTSENRQRNFKTPVRLHERVTRSSATTICILLMSFTASTLAGIAIGAVLTRRTGLQELLEFNSEGLVPRPSSETLVDVPFPPESDYSSVVNMTHTDYLWSSLGEYVNKGVVALSSDDGTLPISDTFPWDTSKSVYILNSFHLVHCSQVIYTTLRRLQQGQVLERTFEHTLHCLDMLRAEATCNADSNLWVLDERLLKDNTYSKKMQTRKCRRWQDLEDFATKNSACFKRLGESDPGFETIEEWRHCPEGSPYKSQVDQYFAAARRKVADEEEE